MVSTLGDNLLLVRLNYNYVRVVNIMSAHAKLCPNFVYLNRNYEELELTMFYDSERGKYNNWCKQSVCTTHCLVL